MQLDPSLVAIVVASLAATAVAGGVLAASLIIAAACDGTDHEQRPGAIGDPARPSSAAGTVEAVRRS